MNKVIYKYQVGLGDNFISLPEGAYILSVHEQVGVIYFWAMVDPQAPPKDRKFKVCFTGEYIYEQSLMFLGTVHSENGLVYHVFEIPA